MSKEHLTERIDGKPYVVGTDEHKRAWQRRVDATKQEISLVQEERDAYSPTEVASRLGCSRRTVDRAIRRGEIRAVRIGGLVRISRREIDRILGNEPFR